MPSRSRDHDSGYCAWTPDASCAGGPGFTFFAVLTIALGLGANAAIFSLVDGVLLKSIGYPEPERIVQFWEKPPRGTRNGIAAANYIDWTQQSQSFEAMAAQTRRDDELHAGRGGRRRAAVASRRRSCLAPYFDVFGVKAALGRTFAKDEDQPGKEKVAVLSHRLWLSLFGGRSDARRPDILLNGEPYTVIGVLPGNSEFDRRSTDLWIPLAFPAQRGARLSLSQRGRAAEARRVASSRRKPR